MNTIRSLRNGLVTVACLLAAALSARAEYDFIKLVDTATTVPGVGGQFIGFADPAIHGHDVVFRGRYNDAPLQEGLYTFNAATGLAKIIDESDLIPGSGSNVEFVSQIPRIHNGRVSFQASNSLGDIGAIATAPVGGGALTTIADNSTVAPGSFGGGTFVRFSSQTDIGGGRVVFSGDGSTGTFGLYAGSGGSLNILADFSTPIPDGGGETFADFESGGPPALSGTTVVFAANGPTVTGLYVTDVIAGGLRAIADSNDPFPAAGGGNFDLLVEPRTDGSNIVFAAQNTGGDVAAFLTDVAGGPLTILADGSTIAPGTVDKFDLVIATSIEAGTVAMAGVSGSTRIGIYTHVGGTLAKVIDNDDVLDGKPVLNLFPTNNNLSDGVIVFSAQFEDNTEGVFAAIAEHHWRANASGSWDSGANWTFGLVPRSVAPTVIDPDNGAIITGPSAPVHVASLTIGAQTSGVAELDLQDSSSLHVNDEVTVLASGRVRVGGVLSAGGGLDNQGVVRGNGQVDAVLSNQIGAEVRVGTGEQLRFTGAGTHTNQGMIEAIGGEAEFNSGLNNAASTGLITGRDAMLRFQGGLTNAGAVALTGGVNDLFGDITNNPGATIVVSGGAAATFYEDIVQNGTFRVSQVGSTTSVAVVLGAFTGSGGSTGGGDIFFEGDLRPGSSPASVNFDNNIALGAGATLEIELGGTSPGTQFDQVHVTGALVLDGTLDVTLIDGFAPQAGQSFDILDWLSLAGVFDTLQLPALSGGLTWNVSQLYTTGVLSVALTGDYNFDGSVDAADYVIWRKTDGTQQGYDAWRTHFGQTAGSGASTNRAEQSMSIPEPNTILLLVAGAAVLPRPRRARLFRVRRMGVFMEPSYSICLRVAAAKGGT